jgi:hypothetical protein
MHPSRPYYPPERYTNPSEEGGGGLEVAKKTLSELTKRGLQHLGVLAKRSGGGFGMALETIRPSTLNASEFDPRGGARYRSGPLPVLFDDKGKEIPVGLTDPLINGFKQFGLSEEDPISTPNFNSNFQKQIGNPMFINKESEQERANRGRQMMDGRNFNTSPEIDTFVNGGPTPEAFKRFEAMRSINAKRQDNEQMIRDIQQKRIASEVARHTSPVTYDYKNLFPYGRNRVESA